MIHPTALIHPNTSIHPSVEIEPFCIIGSDHGSLTLGPGTIIRSHSIIEGASLIGDGLETGHHVLIRANTRIGTNLRIGTGSSLEGGGVIGDYVRIHGRVEMTKGFIRNFARVYANCYITDNRLPPSHINVPAEIGEGAVLAIGCVVIAGVKIGLGSFVGANTTITKDVPAGMALVGGKLKPVTDLEWQGFRYPWFQSYRSDYPPEAHARLDRLYMRFLGIVSGR